MAVRKKTAKKSNGNHATAKEPLTISLTESQRYKIMALQLKVEQRLEQIKAPLIEEARQKLNQAVDRACRNDPQFVKARDARDAALNELIEELKSGGKLEDGYRVVNVDQEAGTVRAVPE